MMGGDFSTRKTYRRRIIPISGLCTRFYGRQQRRSSFEKLGFALGLNFGSGRGIFALKGGGRCATCEWLKINGLDFRGQEVVKLSGL
jgi:hypothetical protein